MNLMDMLKELMEHDNKEEPIIFEVRIYEISRVIRVGKRYSNDSKTWAYCYGETYCPTFAYELDNDDEVNKFLYAVLFSIKGNYIKEIKRL